MMEKTAKIPLLLQSVPKEILWGGDRLKKEYHKTADFDRIAESWELTVRPDGMNTIQNGPFRGQPLSAYLEQDWDGALGSSARGSRFPLLIKFIDARDNLSIQVHPDDAFSLANENEYGKTEMWVILAAEEGAQLVYGLKEGMTTEDFAKAVAEDRVEEALRYVPVKKGDVYFIPSGQVHAIGRGILLAEIQQNSNVTYRVYDYKRRQADGSLRPLHTEKALRVIRLRTEEEIRALRFEKAAETPSRELLCSCAYFRVEKRTVADASTFTVGGESFVHALILEAKDGAALTGGGLTLPMKKGDSFFLPASLGEVTLTGEAEALLSSLQP